MKRFSEGYVIETIKPKKTKGSMKEFKTRKEAEKYAKDQYQKGNAVYMDGLSRTGQTPIFGKGSKRTAFKKPFDKDYGKMKYYSLSKSKTPVKTSYKKNTRKKENKKDPFAWAGKRWV